MRLGGVKGWITPSEVSAADRDILDRGDTRTEANGLEPARRETDVVEGGGFSAPADSGSRPAETGKWPKSRIAAVEALWGEGFISPGGAPETMRLAKPLGLSSKATLLLLGGGLGGPAQAIASGFGTWVASFEAEPTLASLGARRVAALGISNRITAALWDRACPIFNARTANYALALEALRGTQPGPLIDSLAAALRPQGQIVLTELVSDVLPSSHDREFAAWCRLEDRLPELPRSEHVTAAFARLKFDVRVVEDISDRHVTQTLAGWREAVRAMASGPRPAAATAAAFVTEAELWLLRIRLMRRLGVKLMRWHALGAA